MRVATYNVHDCIGRDRRYDPARITRVLSALDADLIALQEITLDHTGDLIARLRDETALHPIDGSLFERGIGRYGNVLLTRVPAGDSRVLDLSLPGLEPRGAVEARIALGGVEVQCYATHLGLGVRERLEQIARLAARVSTQRGAVLLLGDLNLWLPARALAPLYALGLHGCGVRSFPTWPFALGALDRVLVRAPLRIAHCRRYTGAEARLASDHYPVVAELTLDQGRDDDA